MSQTRLTLTELPDRLVPNASPVDPAPPAPQPPAVQQQQQQADQQQAQTILNQLLTESQRPLPPAIPIDSIIDTFPPPAVPNPNPIVPT